jgi:hypothetical protein
MGRASRAKRNREPAPYGQPLRNYFPTRATILFVLGVFVLWYGTGTMKYSRWDHRYNATLGPPTPHVWAIILGIAVLVYTHKKP